MLDIMHLIKGRKEVSIIGKLLKGDKPLKKGMQPTALTKQKRAEAILAMNGTSYANSTNFVALNVINSFLLKN